MRNERYSCELSAKARRIGEDLLPLSDRFAKNEKIIWYLFRYDRRTYEIISNAAAACGRYAGIH